MDAHVAQWIGKREDQQDVYGVKHFEQGSLAIVCDGMGGHCCGAAAARKAMERFRDTFCFETREEIPSCLKRSLHAANEAVGELFAGKDDPGGCTLLAVFLTPSAIWWISVGDSPLFLWRHSQLIRLNQDHSMRTYFAARSDSLATRKEVRACGHMLRSAVMGEPIAMIDLPQRAHPLLPGDRIILSSDGIEDLLHQRFLPPHVAQMLNSRADQLAPVIVDACRRLDEDYADNTTVISFDI